MLHVENVVFYIESVVPRRKRRFVDVENNVFDVENIILDIGNDVFDIENAVSDIEDVACDIENKAFDVKNGVFDVENADLKKGFLMNVWAYLTQCRFGTSE